MKGSWKRFYHKGIWYTDETWKEVSLQMTNEIGKKCLLKFFASIKGFEKVMIQSKVSFCRGAWSKQAEQ